VGLLQVIGQDVAPSRRGPFTSPGILSLLEAATRVGFVREVDVLDADGKPTGRKVPEWDGDGGLAGYLEWAFGIGYHL
jgi:hypothetical protein